MKKVKLAFQLNGKSYRSGQQKNVTNSRLSDHVEEKIHFKVSSFKKQDISFSTFFKKPVQFKLLFSCCHSLCLSITFLHSLLSSAFPSPSPPPMHPSHLSHYTCSLSLPSLNGFQVVIQPLMERAFESSRGPSAPFTALAAAKSGSVVEDDLSLLEGEWESGS